MIKSGKSIKIGLYDLGNRSIRFWQFQNRIKEEAKLEDLKIQECLNLGKGKQGIKGPRHKKIHG
jgi:hypothetical protein